MKRDDMTQPRERAGQLDDAFPWHRIRRLSRKG